MNRFNKIIQKHNDMYQVGGVKRLLTKVLRRLIRWYYHCDIAGAAKIKGVYFCHEGFGVVIHPLAKIGKGTVIQHRVTIGEKETGCVPVIGKNCFIGAGAIVIGGITIGDNVRIGAGSVVTRSIPDGCTVVGVPARIIDKNNK